MKMNLQTCTRYLAGIAMLLVASAALAQTSATGGYTTNMYTENGTNFVAYIFTANGSFTISGSPINLDVLVVGSGGGGCCGGGGAGGYVFSNQMPVDIGTYTVTIGAGGAGGASGGGGTPGGNGTNSVFGSIIAYGGGGGAGNSQNNAQNGASGGGVCNNSAFKSGTNLWGTSQGYWGGNVSSGAIQAEGGGGGAGGPGGNGILTAPLADSSGNGGVGKTNTMSGTAVGYAGGGAGAAYNNGGAYGTNTSGSVCCGGGGGSNNGGTNAVANTGGGGGSGGGNTGGKGGSGIVIVRFVGGPGSIAPVIDVQPANTSVLAPATATFSVIAEGTASLYYQWLTNSIAISGATNAVYTTPAEVLANNGELFSVIVSNSIGSVTSSVATLSVPGANGTWSSTSTAGGSWSDTTKWTGGNVANGVGATGDFSTVTLAVGQVSVTVTNDITGLTLGYWPIADKYGSGGDPDWWVVNSTTPITMDTGNTNTPTISCGSGGGPWPSTIDSGNGLNHAEINAVITGTNGLTIACLPTGWGEYNPVYPRPIVLGSNNTYTGKTTIKSNGWLAVTDAPKVGNDDIVDVNGGIFGVGGVGLAQTNNSTITLENGGLLSTCARAANVYNYWNGNISISGGAGFWWFAHVKSVNGANFHTVVNSSITETTAGSTMTFGGTQVGAVTVAWQNLELASANAWTGNSIFTNGGSVQIDNVNSLGTGPASVIINGTSTTYPTGLAQLMMTNRTATGALNGNLSIYVGPNGNLQLNEGTTLTNTTTLAGGTYDVDYRASSTLNNTHSGSITLADNTTSTISRTAGSAGSPIWYQTGTISGNGSLKISGLNSSDSKVYLLGANTYTGNTFIVNSANTATDMLSISNNTAFGTGPIVMQSATTNGYMFNLLASLTMSNAFSGVGQIVTGSFTNKYTGSFSPGAPGSNAITTNYVGNMRWGAGSLPCTYNWVFTNGASDVIYANNLTFASTTHTLNCIWTGTNGVALGTYTLFKYTGTAPSLTGVSWTITGLGVDSGAVSVDSGNSRVILTVQAPPPGTFFFFQ